MNFLSALDGKKTWIVELIIVAAAAAETFLGVDIPEFSLGLGEAIAVAVGLLVARNNSDLANLKQ